MICAGKCKDYRVVYMVTTVLEGLMAKCMRLYIGLNIKPIF
jgi:hypothetical protein